MFFLGGGFLEVSGRAAERAGPATSLWLQVRDVRQEHYRLLAAGVRVLRAPQQEPWGLIEAWIEDPDGLRLILVEVPDDHPLRRDRCLLGDNRPLLSSPVTAAVDIRAGLRLALATDDHPERRTRYRAVPAPMGVTDELGAGASDRITMTRR